MTAVALAVALVASLCYAVAAALQQHAAGQSDTAGGVRLVAHLLGKPRWLGGVAAMVAGAGLHVLALRLGPLALVQPIGVTGLVFALPLGAALHRRRVVAGQVAAAGAVAAGLVGLLASVQIPPRTPAVTGWHTVVLAATTAAAVLISAVGGRRLHPPLRALVFAAGAGVAFGITSALVRLVAVRVGEVGPLTALLDWPMLVLVAAAIAGLTLSQSAYQVGSLASVLPTLTVVDPITAVALGALLLRQPVRLSGAGSVVAGAGIAAIVAGTVLLARYQARHHSVARPVSSR